MPPKIPSIRALYYRSTYATVRKSGLPRSKGHNSRSCTCTRVGLRFREDHHHPGKRPPKTNWFDAISSTIHAKNERRGKRTSRSISVYTSLGNATIFCHGIYFRRTEGLIPKNGRTDVGEETMEAVPPVGWNFPRQVPENRLLEWSRGSDF